MVGCVLSGFSPETFQYWSPSSWEPHPVCLPLWKTCLSTQRWITAAFMLNRQSKATYLFSTATTGFLSYLHPNLSPLLLKSKPGLLPDLPNLIMESSEGRSDWRALPGRPTSWGALPLCSNWCAMESSATLIMGKLWLLVNRTRSTKCPERMWGKTESVSSFVLSDDW